MSKYGLEYPKRSLRKTLYSPGLIKLKVFGYSSGGKKRDQFVAKAEKDIADGKTQVADLEKKASSAATDAKAKIDLKISSLRSRRQCGRCPSSQVHEHGRGLMHRHSGDES